MPHYLDTYFDGALLLEGDAGYEAARLDAVWNARKPSRFPAAIVRATSDADVSAAVLLARKRGWKVSIRSGGHSWIGNGVRDGGLLIDLSAMDEVTIDEVGRRATVRPAVQGTVFNAMLAARGLVFPSGHCPSVGVGGFLLGGGYGWNSRALGPACFSIMAIDVVLADGELVHADDDSHPELLWAARGSGPGFFGVVTRFYLKVYPLYEQILRSSYVFPIELRDEVLAWSYNSLANISTSVEMSAKVSFSPGLDQSTTMLTAAAFCGPGEGAELLRPIEDAPFIGSAICKLQRVTSTLDDLYGLSNSLTPPGNRYAVDGVWTSAPIAEVLNAGKPILDSIPSRESFLLWMLWGHFEERSDACWSTQSLLYFSPNAVWTDPREDLRHEQWAHAALGDFDSIANGTQFADANPADRPAYGMVFGNAAKLENLRARYDPDRIFRSYLTPSESTTALGDHLRAKTF